MPTVTDEYGRKREVSMEEIRRALANADPGSIMIQEVTTDIYTGQQTVRNIPVYDDGSFDLYGTRRSFFDSTHNAYIQKPETKNQKKQRKIQEKRQTKAELARERAQAIEEEREARIRAQEQEERRKKQVLEDEKVRSRVPEEMQKLMQEAESMYGCDRKFRYLQSLRKTVRGKDKMLQESKAEIEAELRTLELYRSGYSELSRCGDLPEESRELVEEKLQIQEQLSKLSALRFGTKKQLRKRLEELATGIEKRYVRIAGELDEVKASLRKNESDLTEAEQDFLFAKERTEKFLKWREIAIQIFMEENPTEWNLYETDIRPIFEHLDRVGKATVEQMHENHPRKKELTQRELVNLFRRQTVSPFYRREMIRGVAYFSLISPEEWTMEGPKHDEWEEETARVLRERAQRQAKEEQKHYENTLQQNLLRQQKKHKAGIIFAVILACLLVGLLAAGAVKISKIQRRAIAFAAAELPGTNWRGNTGLVKISPDGNTLTIDAVGYYPVKPVTQRYTYTLKTRGLGIRYMYMILVNQDSSASGETKEIEVCLRLENENEVNLDAVAYKEINYLVYREGVLEEDWYSD